MGRSVGFTTSAQRVIAALRAALKAESNRAGASRLIDILIIDDERNFSKAIDHPDYHVDLVRDCYSAIDLIESGKEYAFIFLDHDLGQDEDGKKLTIMPFVDYVGFCCFVDSKNFSETDFFIHTQNPVGRENIKRSLLRHDLTVMDTDAGLWQ